MTDPRQRQNRFWGDKELPKSKAEFFNAVTSPAPSGEGKVATIRMYGPIDSWGGWWGISAKDVGEVLNALGENVEQIILRVNSPGGEVHEGISILNMFRAHKASVLAVVDGLAGSIASCIAAGVDETVMSPGTNMAIHKPWGIEIGNADDLRKHAGILDTLEASLTEIYRAKAGERGLGDAARRRDLDDRERGGRDGARRPCRWSSRMRVRRPPSPTRSLSSSSTTATRSASPRSRPGFGPPLPCPRARPSRWTPRRRRIA